MSIVKPEKVKKLDCKINRKELEVGTVNSDDIINKERRGTDVFIFFPPHHISV